MRQDWFIAATLSVSMLAMAQQQPKVINGSFTLSRPAQDCPQR